MSKHDITLTVNGRKYQLQVESNELLLSVLRDKCYLTGTKYGCGIAECGACSILKDDELYLACMVPAVAADGWNITTAEGLAKNGELSTVQKAFIKKDAIQCGFCTPGMVIAGTALLKKNPHPTEEEIRDFMRGNYCRCTGYKSIIDAIKYAAEQE